MASIIELPRLSDTMEEGVIAQWHIAVGDKVKRGQVIADVETDKATMEFESFEAGLVLKLVASEGETLPIGAPIAVFGKEGENADAVLANHGGATAPAAPAVAKQDPAPTTQPPVADAPTPAPKPVVTAPVAAEAPSPTLDDGRIAASPLARRLAREHGLRLADIEGSGPHGRIVKTDVDAAAAGTSARPPSSTGVVPAPSAPSPFVKADEPQQLSQMRKTIAKRMAQANAEIPHFYLTTEVDMGAVVALRKELKTTLPDTKISFNDFILLAAARALVDHPGVNAYWDGQTIIRRGDIHVGFAAAIDEGLIVPVVRYANYKTLRQIAAEVRDLSTRAREKRLGPDEMSGSTFTVSNLGMFGITEFAAVVNPGEGAILAVGGIKEAVVVEDGDPVVGHRMKMTLSCDHRVMDGAVGARFLATLRGYLESPLTILT